MELTNAVMIKVCGVDVSNPKATEEKFKETKEDKRNGGMVGESNDAMHSEVFPKQDDLIDAEEYCNGVIMMECIFPKGLKGNNICVDPTKNVIYYEISQ